MYNSSNGKLFGLFINFKDGNPGMLWYMFLLWNVGDKKWHEVGEWSLGRPVVAGVGE
jgi:hypothetical protein